MDQAVTLTEPSRRYWIGLIWLGIGLFDAIQTVAVMRSEGMHHAWGLLFLVRLLEWAPWALATPLILRTVRRFPPVHLRPLHTWLAHFSAATVLCLVSTAWIAWLVILLNPYANSGPPPAFVPLWFDKFYNSLLASVILYGMILLVSHMLDSRERLARQQAETARLNEQLTKAQLNALRRQIEPHFLFNTLNAIAGLVREQRNDDAVSMIAGLSEFLRRVVEDSNRLEVPLEEEMEFLNRYLEIQKVRFADRLQLSVDVPRSLLVARVPSLILQPMVENAFKHGIAQRAQGGEIRIRACRCDDTLTLSVYNDGPTLPAGWEATASGTGISNVRTRLQSLYGKTFDLTLRNQEPGGVEVAVSVPFREG